MKEKNKKGVWKVLCMHYFMQSTSTICTMCLNHNFRLWTSAEIDCWDQNNTLHNQNYLQKKAWGRRRVTCVWIPAIKKKKERLSSYSTHGSDMSWQHVRATLRFVGQSPVCSLLLMNPDTVVFRGFAFSWSGDTKATWDGCFHSQAHSCLCIPGILMSCALDLLYVPWHELYHAVVTLKLVQ